MLVKENWINNYRQERAFNMRFKLYIAEIFRRTLTRISPKLNTKVTYYFKFKKKLDLNNPKTLNDKILWLKFNTYWNNSLVKQCADKYKVRDYIKDKNCSEILNELIGVYDRVEDIQWNSLPKSFALKLNVGCGKNIIVSNKENLNVAETKEILKKWLKEKDHYLGYSEMQYKGVKPYVLIEKYLGSEDGELPTDYKFYCLNGKAKYVMVCVDRVKGKHAKFFYFDENWTMMPFTEDALRDPNRTIPKPAGIDEAFKYAGILSSEFPFVRADFYIIHGKVYFGELTFTPSAGMDNGRLPATDLLLGEMLLLPKEENE